MTPPVFIDAAAVAQLLDLPSGPALLARRRNLQDRHGFPAPVGFSSRPLKWRRDLVLAWLDRHGRPDTDLAPDPTGRILPFPGRHSTLLAKAQTP